MAKEKNKDAIRERKKKRKRIAKAQCSICKKPMTEHVMYGGYPICPHHPKA